MGKSPERSPDRITFSACQDRIIIPNQSKFSPLCLLYESVCVRDREACGGMGGIGRDREGWRGMGGMGGIYTGIGRDREG